MTEPSEDTKKEAEKLRLLISEFHAQWSTMESKLSMLLSEALSIDWTKSKVGFAAYFSPTSFDARFTMVSNCLLHFIKENPGLEDLEPVWRKILKRIEGAKNKRNIIAHGSMHLIARPGEDKDFVRITSPVFDVIRTPDKIDPKRLPGLSIGDMNTILKTLRFLIYATDITAHLVRRCRVGGGSLQQTIRELYKHLHDLDGPQSVFQNPPKP